MIVNNKEPLGESIMIGLLFTLVTFLVSVMVGGLLTLIYVLLFETPWSDAKYILAVIVIIGSVWGFWTTMRYHGKMSWFP